MPELSTKASRRERWARVGITIQFLAIIRTLAEVERATDSGSWAFGYVAYEAARLVSEAGGAPGVVVPAMLPVELDCA